MNKIITTTLVAGFAATSAMAEVSTSFDFASAYVFRGVTYNDGAVFQPGIEATGFAIPETAGSLTAGAWGNYDFDDYKGNVKSSEFSEADWYFAYSLPTFVDGLDLFAGYTEYTYPGAGGESDKEFNAGAGYEVAGFGLALTAYRVTDGGSTGTLLIEPAIGYNLELSEALSGSVNADLRYVAESVSGGETGLNDYTVSADLAYALGETWSIGASLTYIGQGDDKVLSDAVYGPGGGLVGGNGYDVDLVGMLSVGASF